MTDDVQVTQNQNNFKDVIALDSKIKTLEKEISILQSKIRKEKQFNRKVELNKILLEKKKDLKSRKFYLKAVFILHPIHCGINCTHFAIPKSGSIRFFLLSRLYTIPY